MRNILLIILLFLAMTANVWASEISSDELIDSWQCSDRSGMYNIAIVFQDEFNVLFSGELMPYFLHPDRFIVMGNMGPTTYLYKYRNDKLLIKFPDDMVYQCRKSGPAGFMGSDMTMGAYKVSGVFCGITADRGFGDLRKQNLLMYIAFDGQGRFQYDEYINYRMSMPGQARPGGEYYVSGDTLSMKFDSTLMHLMLIRDLAPDGRVRSFEFDNVIYTPQRCP